MKPENVYWNHHEYRIYYFILLGKVGLIKKSRRTVRALQNARMALYDDYFKNTEEEEFKYVRNGKWKTKCEGKNTTKTRKATGTHAASSQRLYDDHNWEKIGRENTKREM